MKTIYRVALSCALAVTPGACSSTTFESGGPVSIKLSADRTTARTGENVAFTYDAKGATLVSVVVAFGDGTADTMDTAGAQTARGRFIHAYTAAGTFTAVGTALDGRQGPATDQVVIQITGG